MQTPDYSRDSHAERRDTLGAGHATGSQQPPGSTRPYDDHLGEMAEASHNAISRGALFGAFAVGVANALNAELVQLLEYAPEEREFILRAGHGFPADLYDRTRLPTGLLSQAGRALLEPFRRPVRSEDFSRPHDWAEDRLLSEHGAKSGLAVAIKTGGEDFGALGAFYRHPRSFSRREEGFLLRAAALLGAGIERLGREEEAIAWRTRAELLRAGVTLLKVPAERDTLLSAAAVAAVSGGADGVRPMADWCFADALEGDGRLPRLSRVKVDRADGTAESLDEAFAAPLAPTARHGAPRAYATRQPELVERTGPAFVSAIARGPEHRRAVEEARPFSYVCAPVIGRERFHGAIGFLRTETGNPTPYGPSDLTACSEFAAIVGAAIDVDIPRPDIAQDQQGARELIAPPSEAPGLTEREHEVLAGIASGDRLARIGSTLSISTNTVRTHKRHLCQKLGLSPSSADARIVSEARRRGISDLPD